VRDFHLTPKSRFSYMTNPAARQQQFLNVLERDEAERRWRSAFQVDDSSAEAVPLSSALGRVLASDVIAQVDVPFFDRSNLDGFAVRAEDTYGADERYPVELKLLEEIIATAVVPTTEVGQGEAVMIATGGMLPRGADAIVMVENTDAVGDTLRVFKPVTPGRGLTYAGTDIAKGETVCRSGDLLTSRETGVLAAIGEHTVSVRRLPRVGIISTGDEIISPTTPITAGFVYDSNAHVLSDAVRELGGEPICFGIVADNIGQLRVKIFEALDACDLVLLSGGTSKGTGDLSYQVVSEFRDPGIVVHGVALKPGKPICLAATRGKPVAILPGFPTSAIFTFHEFIASVILEMAGRVSSSPTAVQATMALQVNSEVGRTEYLLVGLVKQQHGSESGLQLAAYPMGSGSGSVTTFARADGFVKIDRHEEIVEAGTPVRVTLLGRDLKVADLVVIGSHCVGLDFLLSELQRRGLRAKFLAVGSTAGLRAIERGEGDLAGIHLLDPQSNTYNRPFLSSGLRLIEGYTRQQGLVFRNDDDRFRGQTLEQILKTSIPRADCVMVNRNQGSGTRAVIDELLSQAKVQPRGYSVQTRSHNAVAASVAQGRSDWGVAIAQAARQSGLGFIPIRPEQFDFVVRLGNTSPALAVFHEMLREPQIREQLSRIGLEPRSPSLQARDGG
jgi:putative molybdopterin biosynthesis protein